MPCLSSPRKPCFQSPEKALGSPCGIAVLPITTGRHCFKDEPWRGFGVMLRPPRPQAKWGHLSHPLQPIWSVFKRQQHVHFPFPLTLTLDQPHKNREGSCGVALARATPTFSTGVASPEKWPHAHALRMAAWTTHHVQSPAAESGLLFDSRLCEWTHGAPATCMRGWGQALMRM